MQATDYLKSEHEVIERALNLLEQAAVKIRLRQTVPEEFGLWACKFFREFADQCHHEKEEELLFPLLEARGIPREGGPIGVMLNEHDIGRDCVRRMEQALAQGSLGEVDYVTAAVTLIELLRQHIAKENQVLFRIADSCLNAEDDARLIEAFAKTNNKSHDRLLADVAPWEACFLEIDQAVILKTGSP